MKRILNALEQRFGGEYILVYRFHHYLYALGMPQNYYADAIDVTYYPDIQELLVAADVVITDYSSLMWDFRCKGDLCFYIKMMKRTMKMTEASIRLYQNGPIQKRIRRMNWLIP